MASSEPIARRTERRWATRFSFRADLEIEWGSAVLREKKSAWPNAVRYGGRLVRWMPWTW
jgi:hypothetical protein